MDDRIRTVLIEDVEELQRTVEELLISYPECYTDDEYFRLFKQIISLKNTIYQMNDKWVKKDECG